MQKILYVEDSVVCQKLLKASLRDSFEVTSAGDLAEARTQLQNQSFQLLILDIQLPDGDGLRFCAEIKSDPKTASIPVIILASSDAIADKATGFQLDIEDYIVKPYDPKELKLRIQARLRKSLQNQEKQNVLSLGLLQLDCQKQQASIEKPDGSQKIVRLSAIEFRILRQLLLHPEAVKSRQQLLENVWQDNLEVSDRAVDSHISRIRKKIEKSGCTIEAIPGAGYRIFSVLTHRKAA